MYTSFHADVCSLPFHAFHICFLLVSPECILLEGVATVKEQLDLDLAVLRKLRVGCSLNIPDGIIDSRSRNIPDGVIDSRSLNIPDGIIDSRSLNIPDGVIDSRSHKILFVLV